MPSSFRLCTMHFGLRILSRGAPALLAVAGTLALAVAGTLALAAAAASPVSTCGLPDFNAGALARINEARSRGADCGSGGRVGPAPPVSWSDELARAADAHARDLVARNVLSHAGARGSTLTDRVEAAGYDWGSVAENVAGGYPSIDAVVAGWVRSPAHCKNLMSADFREAGLACVPGRAGSTYSNFWALNLGRRQR